ncbi:MAG: ABC transporter ATP-binding protein [Planctomycetota bacterium]
MSVLRGEELHYAYTDGPLAVAGVDLSLEQGELLVVIGPNGSGKSTLVRLLGGLLVPRHGEVLLGERALRSLDLRERARELAVVPQGLAVLPEVTVERFVLGGRYAQIGRWRGAQPDDLAAVEAALADADVADLAARRLTELSGGQRQRVLVARALAGRARLLLVDEPTAALDLDHQLRVFALLARLAEGGRSVLVVTHDVNLASQFAARVALLDRGRIVACGAPDDVLRREVLEPVYGRHLHYGRLPGPQARPFVLPWLERT